MTLQEEKEKHWSLLYGVQVTCVGACVHYICLWRTEIEGYINRDRQGALQYICFPWWSMILHIETCMHGWFVLLQIFLKAKLHKCSTSASQNGSHPLPFFYPTSEKITTLSTQRKKCDYYQLDCTVKKNTSCGGGITLWCLYQK